MGFYEQLSRLSPIRYKFIPQISSFAKWRSLAMTHEVCKVYAFFTRHLVEVTTNKICDRRMKHIGSSK